MTVACDEGRSKSVGDDIASMDALGLCEGRCLVEDCMVLVIGGVQRPMSFLFGTARCLSTRTVTPRYLFLRLHGSNNKVPAEPAPYSASSLGTLVCTSHNSRQTPLPTMPV